MIYYNNAELLSYNRLFNFLMGNRGHGKTYSFKRWCIADFIKTGRQFVWVRRYTEEIKLLVDFFNDIREEFSDHELTVKGNKCYIDKKVAGFLIPLSVSQKYKSVPFPNVNKIIYDEYIISQGAYRYLSKEVIIFLELFSTISRTRDNVRAIFISNNDTVANPYFLYFNFFPKPNQRFTVRDDLLIENDKYNPNTQDYIDVVEQTRFGKLIKGTTYGGYAIDNDFLLDNDEYVESMDGNYKYKCCIVHKNRYYGIYLNYLKNTVYVKERNKLNDGLAIAITKDDLSENTILCKSEYTKNIMRIIKEYFSQSKMRYDSIKTKSGFYEIMKELAIK